MFLVLFSTLVLAGITNGQTRKRPHNNSRSDAQKLPLASRSHKRSRLLTRGYHPNGGGGDGDYDGGPDQVINWDPDCNRNANRARLLANVTARESRQRGRGIALDTFLPASRDSSPNEHIFPPSPEEDCPEEDGSSQRPDGDNDYIPTVHQPPSKKKTRIPKNQQLWCQDGIPPILTDAAKRIIISFAGNRGPSCMEALAGLLKQLNSETSTAVVIGADASLDTFTTVRRWSRRCEEMENRIHVNNFNLMIILIQLTLAIDK